MECNACQLEMNNLLSGIPSKWRDQLVKVICDKIVNQELSCSAVKECLDNEMVLIDPKCLTNSQATWDALSYNGKWQLLVDKVCQSLNLTPPNVEDTQSIALSGDGLIDTPVTADLIKDPNSNNILQIAGTGVYVPPTAIANTTCLTFSLSTAGGVRTYTPVLDLDCIAADIVADFSVDAANGLHIEDDKVYLGGSLLEDTTINGETFSFNIDYPLTSYKKSPTFKVDHLDTNSTYVSTSSQSANVIASNVTARAAYNPSTGYTTKGVLYIDEGAATLGYRLPIGGSATPPIEVHRASYFRLTDYTADVIGPAVQILSPEGTLTSGVLESGRLYRIASNSGGANFVPSGASANTVGIQFVANGVTPTWGTGSLNSVGSIYIDSVNASTRYTRSTINHAIRPDGGIYGDGIITYMAPGYLESQGFDQFVRDNNDAYLTHTQFYIKKSNGIKIGSLGVNVPTTNTLDTSAPPEDRTSAYTQWVQNFEENEPGSIYHHAAYNSFLGTDVTENSGDARVGINVEAATNPLHVRSTSSAFYPLRIENPKTPASATATGKVGEISWDSNYIYVCVATNTWKRTALSTW